jgi:hypothetical protein
MTVIAGWAWSAPALQAKDFTFDPKVNTAMAKKLNIPVYFAVPASARAKLRDDIETTDKLIDFKHPDAQAAQGNIGLRLIVAKRQGVAKRLAESGLIKTGDVLLTFRSEWGGAGPYPNVQMGVTHTGVAYVKNGVVHNIDNPLNAEYIGQLNSADYQGVKLLHVVRPRDLDDKDRENIANWASRLAENARRVYPAQLSFNSDYNAPKYKPGNPYTFVKQLGQIALGQNHGTIGMYCSEFAWSLLALRGCDPDKTAKDFARKFMVLRRGAVPSCVKPAMTPMQATGDFMSNGGRSGYSGLAEGPLMVIGAMNLPDDQKKSLVHSVFINNPRGMQRMSSGHRQVAQQMGPKFAALELYYMGVSGNGGPTKEAQAISAKFKQEVPDNYSPTSFLINTLLPPDNANRTMDYVATIVFE